MTAAEFKAAVLEKLEQRLAEALEVLRDPHENTPANNAAAWIWEWALAEVEGIDP